MDYVIIVAGGKGLRMGSEIPKQFLPVAGKPILMRTIERFHEYNPALNIILVLPESQQAYWHQLCEEQFTDDASVVESLGCQVAMVDGNRENIKITTPFDIKVAEALLG